MPAHSDILLAQQTVPLVQFRPLLPNDSAPPLLKEPLTASSHHADILTAIFDESVNLALWQRSQLVSTACEINQYTAWLLQQPQLKLQKICQIAQIHAELAPMLPEGIGQAAFLEDIAKLAGMLGCLMDTETVGVRLHRLTQAMCPRFHTDKIVCRLLVTYQGPGTEWLPHRPTDAQQAQAQPFLQAGLQDVLLMKGSGWEGQETQALWHRSPSSDSTRLLLTLDPM